MGEFHQFHYTARPGDAVTHHALWIRDCLRDMGHDAEFYAVDSRGTEGLGILPLSRLLRADGLFLHHSQENPALARVLSVPADRKALVYHNITPERFLNHDSALADLARRGREQLGVLSKVVDTAFTVSHYNASELQGFRDVRILPLLDLSTPPPVPASRANRSLLFVGRVTPHKAQALLVKILHYLDGYTLTLVGAEDPLYGKYLRLLAKALGLEERVRFAGKISDEELLCEYESAAAFVCVSRHEGFCIPLVEAMRAKLPVFAIPVAAVEETLGGSGVRLPGRKPRKIAETISAVLADGAATEAVLAGQAVRLRALQREQNRLALKQALNDWMGVKNEKRVSSGPRPVRSEPSAAGLAAEPGPALS